MDIIPLVAIMITRAYTSATTSTKGTTEGAEELAQAVQNMSIKTGEIKKLNDELRELQHMKSIGDSSHATELNRVKGQVELLWRELKESFIGNKLGLEKEILWEEITESVKDIWPYVKIVFDQKDLVEKS